MTTTTHRVALVPRDGFFVKDGRGWSTSARTHVLDWPWPTTIRGALTTASGKETEASERLRFKPSDWAQHHRAVHLGRIVALRRLHGKAWSRMWPVPADALWLEDQDKVLRLKPSKPETPTLGRMVLQPGGAEAREALWVPQNVKVDAKPLPPPRWWPEDVIAKWLRADDVLTDMGVPPPKQWPSPEKRLQTHVGIRGDTLTGDDGILYLHDIVETLERKMEWAIGVEAGWPAPAGWKGAPLIPGLARLGSDSRLAWIEAETVSPDLFEMPPGLEGAFGSGSKGLRLMVVTPACFENGWLPDGFKPQPVDGAWHFRGVLQGVSGELILRAACVPRPMHISGWDMADTKEKGGAPRSTSRLVPPGAVYFLERAAPNATFTANDTRALWQTALGGRTHEGFGRVVPGIWNPEDIH